MSASLTTNRSPFIERMKAREQQNVRQEPRPTIVKMNGNTGVFSHDHWNPVKKEYEEIIMGSNFFGTIIGVRYYVQSKYKEGARRFWKTKEFATWSEPVTLQCIDQDSEPKVQEVAKYPTYKDFKTARTLVDKETGEETYNYGLHASLYVYCHSLDQVMCFQSKVGSNNGLFEYFKSYTADTGAEVMAQVKTTFFAVEEVSETLKNEDGTPKKFFALRFKTDGLNTDGELMRIEEMVNSLDKWFETQEVSTVTASISATVAPPAIASAPLTTSEPILNAPAPAEAAQAEVAPELTQFGEKKVNLDGIPF